ncbi:low temperature requirement protein A [Micromonospora sp. HM134]|uniref:low temperature requirement protein A n=1 Tax=unclassified Micromonospora TaxID=2617518 RepID=UPI00119889D1|nr:MULTISPECIES: low temperature requirement protein A [unclassified Micromonospora]QDY09903.1 low temperature requirement protein A [Micromonospora sp. HM134]
MNGERRRGGLGPAVAVAPGARVDKFEVFFDLVFVVSFFIITRATAAEISGRQLLHAGLVLAVLWWCWVVHSMAATRLRLGEGFVPVLMVAAMASLFAFALALPQAFSPPQGELAGPLVVAVSYVVVRGVHVVLFLLTAQDDPTGRRPLFHFLPELLTSTVLLLAAALVPVAIDDSDRAGLVRDVLWILVVLVQYGTGLIADTWSWAVTSAEHWTERYDLILIIALGESIISVGVGGNVLGKPVTWPGVIASALGIVFTAALWWAHFDLIGPAARIALHAATGRRRTTMARDAYAYLYLPMIAGIILFAIGSEELVRAVTDPAGGLGEQAHGPAVPLFFGGVICYLASNMLFQLRTLHTLSWTRVGTLVVLAAAVPVAAGLSALGGLALLTAICVGLVTIEVVTMSGSRQALRRAVHDERADHEAHEAAWRARWHEANPAEGRPDPP